MTTKQKIAIKTARECAINPKAFPMVDNKHSEEENQIIAKTLETLFEFDEQGNVIDFCEQTLDEFCWIAQCPRRRA